MWLVLIILPKPEWCLCLCNILGWRTSAHTLLTGHIFCALSALYWHLVLLSVMSTILSVDYFFSVKPKNCTVTILHCNFLIIIMKVISFSLSILACMCMTALLAGGLWTESQGHCNMGPVYSFLGLWHHVMDGWSTCRFLHSRGHHIDHSFYVYWVPSDSWNEFCSLNYQ